MTSLVPLKVLFEPVYGVNLELVNVELCDKKDKDSIRFISRKDGNNGLAAYVKKNELYKPNPKHTLSVAVSGSVLSCFYQDSEYYSGRDLYYLVPRKKMTIEEMMFYALCIRANKYKYNYGRGANRTLKDIMVPAKVPREFLQTKIENLRKPARAPILPETINLNTDNWGTFIMEDFFDVKKGKRLTKEDMEAGDTPFIAAIDSNNGWRDYISRPAIHEGNTITVNYNGSVAEAFYQPLPFWASDDVNVLYPKFKMNVAIGLFMATIIRNEKYRFNFGRKWHKERMEKSEINLPSKNGKPDYQFMEKFIKSLPYSSSLEIQKNEVAKHSKSNVGIAPQKGLNDEPIKKYESGPIDQGRRLKNATE